METLALSFQNKEEKRAQKSGGKPPEQESHISLFSLAATMKTVENRKRFTHRSHSCASPYFSSPTFSLPRNHASSRFFRLLAFLFQFCAKPKPLSIASTEVSFEL